VLSELNSEAIERRAGPRSLATTRHRAHSAGEQNIVQAVLRIVRSANAEEAEAMTRMITKFDRYIARHKVAAR